LTTKVEVDDGLYAELKKHLSDREIVELTVTVATANFTNRVNDALKTDLEQ
jgi:alkylhydroperoxidase family enzyme